MRIIEITVLSGILIYALIALLQGFWNSAVLIQSAALIIIFAIVAYLLKIQNEEKLKAVEMAAVWGCIGLFAAYILLAAGGIL